MPSPVASPPCAAPSKVFSDLWRRLTPCSGRESPRRIFAGLMPMWRPRPDRALRRDALLWFVDPQRVRWAIRANRRRWNSGWSVLGKEPSAPTPRLREYQCHVQLSRGKAPGRGGCAGRSACLSGFSRAPGPALSHQFFCCLTHRGRKSGQPRQTVLEVVRYDRASRTYVVASGWGVRSDWYRNIQQNPDVVVESGSGRVAARRRFCRPPRRRGNSAAMPGSIPTGHGTHAHDYRRGGP